jgi:transposase InsO family protein
VAECQTVRMAAKWYHEINGLLWLRDEFVFLAVILDAFSRRVIGWALDGNMEDVLRNLCTSLQPASYLNKL